MWQGCFSPFCTTACWLAVAGRWGYDFGQRLRPPSACTALEWPRFVKVEPHKATRDILAPHACSRAKPSTRVHEAYILERSRRLTGNRELLEACL